MSTMVASERISASQPSTAFVGLDALRGEISRVRSFWGRVERYPAGASLQPALGSRRKTVIIVSGWAPTRSTRSRRRLRDRACVYSRLAEEKVLIVQGTGFNWIAPDHFRVVFLPNSDDLTEAIGRIARFLDSYRRRYGKAA